MRILVKTTIGLTLLLFAVWCGAEQPTGDICRFFPNNTKIRDPHSCSNYIECIDFQSHYSPCTGKTPFFDKNDQKCVASLSNDTLCSINCENSTQQFIADPASCSGYFYCLDEIEAIHGNCPEGQHFNATRQVCTFKDVSDCHTKQFDFCQIVKDKVNILDESHCGQYYSCTKQTLKTNACKDTYYQAISGKCVDKSKVDCARHPLPNNVCGTAKSPKNGFAADGATCRGYFYCAKQDDGTPDPNPFWGQCPPDTFFDASTKTCVAPLSVACSWDRCDGRSLMFVTSKTKGCRNYLRCINGITDEELSCNNMFFDEVRGACISDIVHEKACA